MLDRIPHLDVYKIGVVYVESSAIQTLDQRSILLTTTNTSLHYIHFLQQLGIYMRLTDCGKSIFTGGLDTTNDIDGTHSIYHQDQLAQVIFHVVTLMPNRETDSECTAKKRHIGNDFVTIVFMEDERDFERSVLASKSDQPLPSDAQPTYTLNTLASQFNYINVLVCPVRSRTTTAFQSFETTKFRVNLLVCSQLSYAFDRQEPMTLLGTQLGKFIRNLSVNMQLFCQIHSQGGVYQSNLKERLRQLQRLVDRFGRPIEHVEFSTVDQLNEMDWTNVFDKLV